MGVKCPKCQHENPDDTIFCGKCATRLPSQEKAEVTETLETPKEELTTGSTFAERYQIIEELGKGGMGRVYKAHDTKIKEKIALKLIKPEIAKDKKTIERFSNELRLARKIRHKNVCGMFDLGEEKGTHYITMEFVPGEDLRSLIRRIGQLPVGKSISIAKQICEGLAEAHRLGVVHRDLKSNNIMIDQEGNVRIMDFGIARSLEAKGITGAGVMIGTPEYMSPEQVEGKETDQRSDIYSLGVILYEMVTGRVPFEGDTPFTIGMKHKGEMPQNPKELNAQISDDLNHLILRCLEKEKDKRYQRAGEVRSNLERMEKGIPAAEKVVPKKKPITSKEITVTFGLKKLFIPALIIVVLIVAAILIWQLLIPTKEAILKPSDKPTLAVVFFENTSNAETLEGWRTGLPELLITDLSQSKFIDCLSSDRIYSILRKLNLVDVTKYSSEDMIEIAHQGQITHIVKGSLIKADENIIITATLQKTDSGEMITSRRLECRGENEIFSRVDELTREIKSALELSSEQLASDIDKNIIQITTSSPEAYRYYQEGRKYFQEDPLKSIAFMQRALEIDPEFAMAYRSIGMAYNNMRSYSEGRKYIQKAFALKDRISDRERYQIQGAFYWQSEETLGKAIEAYKELLRLYPNDDNGNLNLGCIYRDLRQWDKAIDRFEYNRRNNPESIFSLGNLANALMAIGDYERAREVLDEYINTVSDIGYMRWLRAIIYAIQQNFNMALADVEKGIFLNPDNQFNFLTKGNIYHFNGDFSRAEKEYMKVMKSNNQANSILGNSSLAGLYLTQGRYKDFRNQLEEKLEKERQLEDKNGQVSTYLKLTELSLRTGRIDNALRYVEKALSMVQETNRVISSRLRAAHLRGLIQIKMKSFDEARNSAAQIKESVENWLNSTLMRYHYHLMGKIELEKGNHPEAIAFFKKTLSLLSFQNRISGSHAFFIDSLALAHVEAGDLEGARQEYERITTLTTGRLEDGDIYAKSFYMIGKIYEQQGDTPKAIEYYEKFLSLWKDADPGIAEVEDAKKRLVGLKE